MKNSLVKRQVMKAQSKKACEGKTSTTSRIAT
jgi:hypothetical protein